MSKNYITILDKMAELGVGVKSLDMYQLSEALRSNGATVVGYVTDSNGEDIQLLYENSGAFDGALERCGVSLPEKKVQVTVEAKKGLGSKIEKDEDAIPSEMNL